MLLTKYRRHSDSVFTMHCCIVFFVVVPHVCDENKVRYSARTFRKNKVRFSREERLWLS